MMFATPSRAFVLVLVVFTLAFWAQWEFKEETVMVVLVDVTQVLDAIKMDRLILSPESVLVREVFMRRF
jgi:hypothetical protein